MSERINIAYCASGIAHALLNGLKRGDLQRVDIDCIRSAVAGYLCAGNHIVAPYDREALVQATLRNTLEKV